MFGTMGHARVKPGHLDQLKALEQQEWMETMRPQVTGRVINLMGSVAGDPNQLVLVALMQDEETYRRLASDPQ